MCAGHNGQPEARSPPPQLPEPRSLRLDGKAIIQYIDINPPDHSSQSPTIVLIHGSPGSFNDFRHLVPLLQDACARIIAITLPGFGGSEVIDPSSYYEHVVPLGGARLTLEALRRLCGDEESVFVVGHSFGGHTAINIVAMSEEKIQGQKHEEHSHDQHQSKLNVRGIVLLASVGHRMPDSQWPIGSLVLGTLIRSELPVLAPIASYMARLVYTKLLKFPESAPTSHYASGMVRSAATDFEVVEDHLRRVAHIPAFVAWAKNDMHLSAESSEKLSRACHPGPRLAFERGGHNIQKTQAATLATQISQWISACCSS
ncbi:hypothetical protein PybrP1_008359 [[Pythium] brassicae (nom. inval.)]|nr:hypothetical protein PybrP1_008359 [[Pythium] brassicae (nom. inval.)]